MPTAAHAEAILERAYFEDATGQLQYPQIASNELINYSGALNRGYSKSVLWLRFKIQPETHEVVGQSSDPGALNGRYILRVQPGYLDEISLFDPLEARTTPRSVGDQYSTRGIQYRSLNHNFVILAGQEPRYIWLRLKSQSTHLIYVQALTFSEALAADRLQDLMVGIFIGSLLLFFFWALTHYLSYGDRIIGLLAANQLVALIFALSILGYFRMLFGELLPAEWLDLTTSYLAILATCSSIVFNLNFLSEFDPSRHGIRVLKLLAALAPLEWVLLSLGQVRLAMQMNMITVTLAPLLCLLTALTVKGWSSYGVPAKPVLAKRFLVMLYGVSLCMLMVFALPSLGWTTSSELALQTNSIYGFVTGILLVVTLQLRAKWQQKIFLEGQKNLELAQQQVDQEKRQRQEQVQFMAMLTHELKTPLAIVRMALGSQTNSASIKQRADQAIGNMSKVIDRCAWLERLDGGSLAIKKSGFNLEEELDRLVYVINGEGRIQRAQRRHDILVESDVRLVSTALNNLLDNALSYSKPGSPVAVSVDCKEHNNRAGFFVAIANQPGTAGWPEAEKIFQKYYRSPGAHHQTGSGLGLYQSAQIARQLGGDLTYVPDEKHVRFELWLPA